MGGGRYGEYKRIWGEKAIGEDAFLSPELVLSASASAPLRTVVVVVVVVVELAQLRNSEQAKIDSVRSAARRITLGGTGAVERCSCSES
jgi:hypothetical protein